jgi:hypothetical protein
MYRRIDWGRGRRNGSVPLRGEHVLPLLLSVSLLSVVVRAAYYGQPRRIYPVRALLEKFRTSVLGHEEQLPPSRLSAGSGFSKETFNGGCSNGQEA